MVDHLMPAVMACGVWCMTFGLIGLMSLIIAERRARDLFRSKGYLRPPTGTKWIPFLLRKHYDAFDDSETRFFFHITRICLLATILAVTATLLLVGSTLLLKVTSKYG